MSVSQTQMLQAIHDTLFGAFTMPPPGQTEAAASPDKTYLTLNWPGNQVDVAQFAEPWTPQNPTGNMTALENFSTFVDRIPNVHPIFSDSGQRVSDVYRLIVNAQVVPPPPDPAAEAAYQEASQFLNAEGTDFDADGKKVTVSVDSPVYANYKRKRKAYGDAVAAFMANYIQYDVKKPEDQRKWSLLGPTYQATVTSAYQDLINAQQTKVEDMLAKLSQSARNQVGQLFMNARRQYEILKRASVSTAGLEYGPSYAFPANWYSTSAAESWSSVTISSNATTKSEHSDFRDIAAQVEAKGGIWAVGGDFSMHDSHENMSSDTRDLTISFKFARVEVVRPWFNNLLLEVGGWSLNQAHAPGKLSNGTKQQSGTTFPLLPTAFIAVRDLTISADWGKEDKSLIDSKLAAKATLSYGPFSVSGSYAQGSSDKKIESTFDGTKLTNSGLQIVGWINTVIPFAPPKM